MTRSRALQLPREMFQAVKDESYKAAPFHRVILHDAVQYFNDMEKTFKNLLKVLHKFGKVKVSMFYYV